jgi:hypothetical protein
MKTIGLRLWREPVFLGTALLASLGAVAAFGLGWTGEQVWGLSTVIAALTGAEHKRQRPN